MAEGFDATRFKYQVIHPNGRKELFDDIRSMVGTETYDAYDNEENRQILLSEFSARFGHEVSLTDALNIYARFHSTNRILSSTDREAAKQAALEAEQEAEVVETTPQPSEHEVFYNANSGLKIRERIARDPEFAKYARARMSTEVIQGDGIRQPFYWPVFKTQADTPEAAAEFVVEDTEGRVIHDKTWPIIDTKEEFRVPVIRRDGGPPLSVCDIHVALRKFAQQYTQTPSSQLRPIMGFVTMQDGTRFDVQKFNQLVAEATAERLI